MTPSEITLLQLCICSNPDCTIPYGFCHCGCGKITSIVTKNKPKSGLIKGKPCKFAKGHRGSQTKPLSEGLCICGEYNCAIPYGLCHCGCGSPTSIAKHDRKERDAIKGFPHKFLFRHRGYKTEVLPEGECICGSFDCAIPYGYCHCGCGGKADISRVNKPKQRLIMGMPKRFINNHSKLINGRTQNAEERLAYAREYRKKKNEKEIKSKRKKYREDTKEEREAYNKKYIAEHYEEVLERGRRQTAYYIEYFPEKFLLWSAKRRAKSRHLPFNIEESDICIPTVCPILGIPLKRGVAYGTKNSPSIDRVIPKLGYVKGNIQIISKMANAMKQDATFEQMVKLGEWAGQRLNERDILRLEGKDATS